MAQDEIGWLSFIHIHSTYLFDKEMYDTVIYVLFFRFSSSLKKGLGLFLQ